MDYYIRSAEGLEYPNLYIKDEVSHRFYIYGCRKNENKVLIECVKEFRSAKTR